jgi:hypothetical protein
MLLGVSVDLRLVILQQLDLLSLVRTSRVCKALHQHAADDALWQRHVTEFFDGELPPPEMLPALTRDVLCEAVKFARAAASVELDTRRFLLGHRVNSFSPQGRALQAWSDGLDARVAAFQNREHAYYGACGGSVTTAYRAYGRFQKAVHTHCTSGVSGGLLSGTGVTEAEARLCIWVKLEWAHVEPKRPKRKALRTVELTAKQYEALAAWFGRAVDGQLATLLATTGAAARYQLRSAAPKGKKPAGGAEGGSSGAAARCAPSDDSIEYTRASRAPPEQLSVAKLRCGAYGGLLSVSELCTSIGSLTTFECMIDGSKAAFDDF